MATITHARGAVIQTLYAQEMGNDKAIEQFEEILKDKKVKVAFTGSASMGLCEELSFPFVQEVVAATYYIKRNYLLL